MPELSALGTKDLKEVAQTMARAIYATFEEYKPEPEPALAVGAAERAKQQVQQDRRDYKDRHGKLNMRVFRALYDSGAIKEEEFNGSGLNAARRGVITEFKVYYDQALDLAKFYEKCVEPVEEMAPHFAMPSNALVRMWCVAHYWKTLSKTEGPFANLQVENGTGMHDEDGTEESEEGEEEEASGDEASGEESEESEEEEEGDDEGASEKEAEGTDDDEDSSSSSSEEEEEEEEPDPAEETAEEYAERNKYKNPVPPDFGLKGFDAEYARYAAKETEKINREYERAKHGPPKKRARDAK